MLVYLFRADESSRSARAFWLLVQSIAQWFGSALYYFIVYRKQVRCLEDPKAADTPLPQTSNYWR
jgi:hypothetical protein